MRGAHCKITRIVRRGNHPEKSVAAASFAYNVSESL